MGVSAPEMRSLTRLTAEELSVLLATYAATGSREAREEIILRHEGLVRALAHKFARPGAPVEDLIQTGWIGLIGAVERFDPSHATQFPTYAVTCITGEIKRFFRDRTWAFKVPRALQELAMRLERIRDEAQLRLQRPATIADMAETAGVTEEAILEAMEVARVYLTSSLDSPQESRNVEGGECACLADSVGYRDPAIESAVEKAPMAAAMAELEERDQLVIRRRYFDEWSQERVGQELGVSQMQVSRLERRALKRLKQIVERAPREAN